MVIAVRVKAMLPVFAKVTANALLVVPNAWFEKVSESGLVLAVVRLAPAVHSGVCHTPRP
jgi:hypothetical protein